MIEVIIASVHDDGFTLHLICVHFTLIRRLKKIIKSWQSEFVIQLARIFVEFLHTEKLSKIVNLCLILGRVHSIRQYVKQVLT